MPRWPYGTRQWRYTRLAKLTVNPLCEVCGAVADQVDHKRPVADGGAVFDMGNLRSLCQRCHSFKTASEDGAFGNRKGKTALMSGCLPDGTPIDPAHEWNGAR
jgi:5-methylcytosine-specific restriction protein A